MQQSTPKRRRLDGATGARDEEDVERTPRAPASLAGSEIPSLSSRSTSVASGQSSPTRQMNQLRLNSKGVDFVTMDVDDVNMPYSLAEITSRIELIAANQHIVPAHLEVRRSYL